MSDGGRLKIPNMSQMKTMDKDLILLMPVEDMDVSASTTIHRFWDEKRNRQLKVFASVGELKHVTAKCRRGRKTAEIL
jgi:hypothetical protein